MGGVSWLDQFLDTRLGSWAFIFLRCRVLGLAFDPGSVGLTSGLNGYWFCRAGGFGCLLSHQKTVVALPRLDIGPGMGRWGMSTWCVSQPTYWFIPVPGGDVAGVLDRCLLWVPVWAQGLLILGLHWELPLLAGRLLLCRYRCSPTMGCEHNLGVQCLLCSDSRPNVRVGISLLL